MRETAFRPSTVATDEGIQGLYGALARDETRNAIIFNDVIGALADGRSPILLTERRDHLEYFATKLRPYAASGRPAGRDGSQVRPRRA